MRARRRGVFATSSGRAMWEEAFVGLNVPLARLLQRAKGSGRACPSPITVQRAREGVSIDTKSMEAFFLLVGITAAEGSHYQREGKYAAKLTQPAGAHRSISAIERLQALSQAERRAAAALSIFQGGWTIESVQAVLGPEVWTSHPLLVKKGIVLRKQGRFDLREDIRSAALRSAQIECPSMDLASEHSAYFCNMALDLARDLTDGREAEVNVRFTEERHNIVQALCHQFLIEGQLAFDCADAVGLLFHRAELWDEGVTVLEWVFERWQDPLDARFVRCLSHHAKYHVRLQRFPNSKSLVRRAMRAAKAIDEAEVQVECHTLLSMFDSPSHSRLHPRRLAAIRARNRAALHLVDHHGLGDVRRSRTLFNLAIAANDGTQPETVRALAVEAHKSAVRGRSLENIGASLALIACVDHWETRFDEAIEGFGRAIAAFEEYGAPFRLFWAVKDLGETYLDAGRLEEALAQFQRAQTLAYLGQNIRDPIMITFLIALTLALLEAKTEARAQLEDGVLRLRSHPQFIDDQIETLLMAGTMLAADSEVRRNAFVSAKELPNRERPRSLDCRYELIRIAGGIEQPSIDEAVSKFSRTNFRSMIEDIRWLDSDVYGTLTRF